LKGGGVVTSTKPTGKNWGAFSVEEDRNTEDRDGSKLPCTLEKGEPKKEEGDAVQRRERVSSNSG